MKRILALFLPLLCLMVALSACSVTPSSPQTYETSAPLAEPTYGYAEVATFDLKEALGPKQDFIFKGTVNKVWEVNVNRTAGEKIEQWNTVCDVAVKDVLYGSAPDGRLSIRVVFGQTTRSLDKTEFQLIQGKDYYFITHVFNDADRARKNAVPLYELGDALGGTFYNLFPVENGVVSYLGWGFTGERLETGLFAHLGAPMAINEKAFLEKFTAMIRAAKGAGK